MLNPRAIAGAILFFFVSVGGAYFYGKHDGRVAERAAVAEALDAQFKRYAAAVSSAAAAGTASAMADFNAKTSVLEDLATRLKTAQGVMNNAAARLSSSLRDACRLNPDQRRMLECLRRPNDPGCAAAPGSPAL